MKALNAEITAVPELLREKYLPSLDGLRAVSVALVVLTHTNIFITHKLGVEIFFVISGFLITSLLLREKIDYGFISLKKFYIRRFFRIIPVAFLYITFILLLNITGQLNPEIGWFYFFCAAFSLANLFNNTWYFTHFWSLATEEQFYLFFPLVLRKGTRFYLLFVLFFFIAIFTARFFEGTITKKAYPDPGDLMHYMHYFIHAIKYFEGILIGSLLAVFLFKNYVGVFASLFKKVLADVLLILSVAVLWKYNNIGGIFNHTLLLTAIAFFILNNLKPSKDPVFFLLNTRVFRYIGLMSYSIYVWQQPFTKFIPWAGAFPGAGSLWFNMLLLAVVVLVSYNFWEKYFLKLKAKFYQDKTVSQVFR